MSVVDRAMAALFALLVAALAVAIIAVIAGWVVLFDFVNMSMLSLEQRLAIVLIAVIFFLLAIRCLFIVLRTAPGEKQQVLINSADLGTVSIAMPALDTLITRAARQVKGVREVQPRFKVAPEGLLVRLNITVTPDRNLPEMTAALQEKVHEYIVATAGLDVSEIHVQIKGIYREGLRRVE